MGKNVFVVSIQGVIQPEVYTSFQAACDSAGINVRTGFYHLRDGIYDHKGTIIRSCAIVTIKGRGRRSFGQAGATEL